MLELETETQLLTVTCLTLAGKCAPALTFTIAEVSISIQGQFGTINNGLDSMMYYMAKIVHAQAYS